MSEEIRLAAEFIVEILKARRDAFEHWFEPSLFGAVENPITDEQLVALWNNLVVSLSETTVQPSLLNCYGQMAQASQQFRLHEHGELNQILLQSAARANMSISNLKTLLEFVPLLMRLSRGKVKGTIGQNVNFVLQYTWSIRTGTRMTVSRNQSGPMPIDVFLDGIHISHLHLGSLRWRESTGLSVLPVQALPSLEVASADSSNKPDGDHLEEASQTPDE